MADGDEQTIPPADPRFGGPIDAREAIQPISGIATRRQIVIIGDDAGGVVGPGNALPVIIYDGTGGSKSEFIGLTQSITVPLGAYETTEGANAYGYITGAPSGTTTDLWPSGGAMLWTTTPAPVTVTSSSGADNGKTVLVAGITSWAGGDLNTPQTYETVTIGGAASANSYVALNGMVMTAGSDNVGTVTATNGTVLSVIEPDDGRAQRAFLACDALHDVLITNFYAGATAGNKAEMTVVLDAHIGPQNNTTQSAFILRNAAAFDTNAQGEFTRSFDPYMLITGPCIVKMTVQAGTTGMNLSGGFNAYITATDEQAA